MKKIKGFKQYPVKLTRREIGILCGELEDYFRHDEWDLIQSLKTKLRRALVSKKLEQQKRETK